MSAPLPILYSFRRCPYAMRARMGIISSGLNVELREVLLKDKPSEMVEASPKATVPVLVDTDGTVVDESLDVMLWALGQSDPENWLSEEAIELIAHNDGPFKAALDRYKYPNRYASETIDRNEQRAICASTFKRYEERLTSQKFLLGNRPTIADNAIFPFVRQCANVDREWFDAQPWPNLQKWLEHFLSSERFDYIMRKNAPWQTGDEPLIFGG
ncbi:glutathione S-transferase [Ahrensia marina]|uniref:Glutathione S-transferase n=1 Tax=Ahrensia marina TaxID=1514904 RepID=A0A0N0E8C3_9HYPH|nr:glutathione S-transferase [Ahrensia marina]KPB02211.1 glutathione S-transferase [Ahrensia marina]